MSKPTWDDLLPGDTVVEHDGHKAVFVIAKEASLKHHWDVVVLSSNHPNNGELTAYREFWIRRVAPHPRHRTLEGIPIPSNHEVIRAGATVYRT